MKRLIIISVFIFTIIFSCSILAQSPLPAGTYTIGSGGNYSSIYSAFSKLQADGIAGPVIFELTDTLYTAALNGFYLSGPILGAGSNSRITIQPADNKNVIVEGPGNGFQFSNVSYLTLDGVSLSGASTLTVHALSNTQIENNLAVYFSGNSDHNIIQNLTVITDNLVRSVGIGFVNFNTASVDEPDSNLIQNNFIKKAWNAIYVSSWSSSGVLADGNIIRGNLIGSETDSLISWAIEVEETKNTIIEDNIVQNIRTPNGNNGFPDPFIFGIDLDWCNNGIIRNNVVHNVKSNSVKCIGILLRKDPVAQSGSNNLVYNNMVYDIECKVPDRTSTSGIEIGDQINPQIYYNSVYLSGTGIGTSSNASVALLIGQATTNVLVKNNIFVNTMVESPGQATLINDYEESNLTSNNNDLYCLQNQNSYPVVIKSTRYNLQDWQARGQDLLSVVEMPNFKAPDLHIDESIPTYLEKRGTPIADIDTDFEGDLRDTNYPDIGADEINGQVPVPLSGGYSVGTEGHFPTISDAFDTLSANGVAGPVTFELIDTLYTAPTSDGFGFNGPITGAGSDSRVTIRPAVNKNVTVEGSGTVFQFANLSYFTFDGVALTGATTFTVHSLGNSGISFYYNSDKNIIQNMKLITEKYQDVTPGAIAIYDQNESGSVAPDSNLIQNNFIKKSGIAIYLANWSVSTFGLGNIIRGNIIGSETDSLIFEGIQVEGTQNTIIEGNDIQNIRSTVNGSLPPSNQFIHGININGAADCIIRDNIVHNVKSSSKYPCAGILLTDVIGVTVPTNDNLVYNNMVYDIQCTLTTSGSYTGGIVIRGQNSPKVYYNSVYLSGTGNGANHRGSAALWIEGNCTNVAAKNNILVNARDESPYTASSIYDYVDTNLTSDNNDLFYSQNQYNCSVTIGSTKYNTLPDWQAKGEDLLSISEMPNFKAPDLHIDESIPTNLESHGTPIAGIDVDFDGETRDTVSTDIGADEFKGTTIVAVNDKVMQPLEFKLEQNYPNPFNPSTTIKYSIPQAAFVSLKVYDLLGREVASLINDEKPAGYYEVKWNGENFASGIYFYKIEAGSFVETKKMILIK